MKKLRSLYIIPVILLMIVGCDDSNIVSVPADGVGTFTLSLAQGDVQSEFITRSSLNLDTDNFLISLSEADGNSLVEGKKLGALTEAECTLPAGTGYQIKAESCTPNEAVTLNGGWGMAYFVASTTFDIVSNQHTPVSLTCTMNNVGLQVVFDQSFLDKFPIHAATTQDSRSIVFSQSTQERTAYFPVEGASLNMKLRLTGSAGGWEDRIDVVKELTLSKGKIYTINITYSETQGRGVAMKIMGVE